MPLIVATLGGTGVGKSTLLNALVGEKIVKEGKTRPTTAEPILICHTMVNPNDWGVDLLDLRIEKRNLPTLERLVFVDCPDPDTTENPEQQKSNLSRLRAVLPLCDILLVVGTQQKYKSRRVLDELAAAAPGARLVFVQTHADKDVDIRDDWSKLLSKDYETGRIYLVDSSDAQKAEEEKRPLPTEFEELRRLLTQELTAETAVRVRQANYFGLAETTVSDCREEIVEHWTPIRKLRERIEEERRRFGIRLSEKMREELLRDRRLWESRLIGRVASQWGYSPFSMVLRIYQGLGALISSSLLARVRSIPQLAVWGALEGMRSYRSWSDNRKLKNGPGTEFLSNWEESRLRESALILTGFATDAKIATEASQPAFVLEESKRVGEAYLADLARELELICDRLAAKNNRWWMRFVYEFLFGSMTLFLLVRLAKNFFFDTIFHTDAKLYGADFYLISIFWLIAWGALLLGMFTFMLRNGLDREISESSVKWNRLPSLDLLFGGLETETKKVLDFRDELDTIGERIAKINRQAESLDQRLGKKK